MAFLNQPLVPASIELGSTSYFDDITVTVSL